MFYFLFSQFRGRLFLILYTIFQPISSPDMSKDGYDPPSSQRWPVSKPQSTRWDPEGSPSWVSQLRASESWVIKDAGATGGWEAAEKAGLWAHFSLCFNHIKYHALNTHNT